MKKQMVYAILLAAGSGSRMQAEIPKQYLSLAGQPLIYWSLQTLLNCNFIDQVTVVLGQQDQQFSQLALAKHQKIQLVTGGPQREHSCMQALQQLLDSGADHDAWVLVHDAARPCLTHVLMQQLFDALSDDDIGGILAIPSTDTLKRVQDHSITETLDRQQIWRAQTPQMFRLGALHNAYQQAIVANAVLTDEASALELVGAEVKIVIGADNNIKVTKPGDLQLAEFYLSQLNKEEEG